MRAEAPVRAVAAARSGAAGALAQLAGLIARSDDEQALAQWPEALPFLEPADALRHIDTLLRGVAREGLEAALESVLLGVLASADPDLALVNLVRYAETRFGAGQQGQLVTLGDAALGMIGRLFGYSQFLADLLIRYPHYLEWLAEDPELEEPRTVERLLEVYRQALGPFQRATARRAAAIRTQRRELLRLGARRMLELSDEAEMARELSDLASATLRLALDESLPELIGRYGQPIEERAPGESQERRRAGFAIIGMGKLGGRELNFSSDIDLLFIYSDEGQTAGRSDGSGRISNHVFFTKLAESVITMMTETSDEGYFYRVDTRLRPDGETGPLVRSLSAYEIYYETQARSWERLALLRARAVAGDPPLGRAFESMSRPLVYDPLHSEELVAQIYDLKQRIDHEIGRRDGAEREVKRGAGGIRELEFLVQTMQMLYGADRPDLWAHATLDAIMGLHRNKLLPALPAAQMIEDYTFLRTIEHRLQMMHLRQTHMMPDTPRELDALARRCGIEAEGGVSPGERLLARWGEVSTRVHRDFLEFFAQRESVAEPVHAAPPVDGEDPAIRASHAVLGNAPEQAALALLAPFGLGAKGSLKSLRRLGGMGISLYLTAEARAYYEQLLPRLLRLCAVNPQPETALANFESFLLASGALGSFYAIFLGNPAVLDLLMLAFGSGQALSQTLISHPEYVDHLADPAFLGAPAERGEMRARLTRWTGAARGDEAFAAALARARHFDHLVAGLGEIAGLLDYAASCRRLNLAAEVIIEAALARVAVRLGLGERPRGYAVLAMGKLGSGELNYFSDLDLIFAWDETFATEGAGTGAGPSPAERATELSEGLIGLLTHPTREGAPYSVDARLRPEGQNAPLAPPVSRYLTYYAERGQLWEFQSAMKLRPIAGDAELGARLVRGIGEVITGRLAGQPLGEPIRQMRARMETALKLPRWMAFDFKTGRGGTVDLEFIAQFLQLKHLGRDPELMGLGPLAVFERLEADGLLEPATARALIGDMTWLRRLERRVRLLQGSDRSQVPQSGEKLAALERACRPLLLELAHEGAPGAEPRPEHPARPPALPPALLDALGAVLRRNRRHFDNIIQDAP